VVVVVVRVAVRCLGSNWVVNWQEIGTKEEGSIVISVLPAVVVRDGLRVERYLMPDSDLDSGVCVKLANA